MNVFFFNVTEIIFLSFIFYRLMSYLSLLQVGYLNVIRLDKFMQNLNNTIGKATINKEEHDGNLSLKLNSDIILLGVSRTSKAPTSIYLANRGYKTSNIPLVNKESLPNILKNNPKLTCIVGLTTDPERLKDIRKNRMISLKEKENINYTNFEKISKEVDEAKKIFKKYNWPTVDITRKSVEETAASVIKIYEIEKENG